MSRPLRRLLEDFERANRENGLLKKGDSLLVAVSGGPDSTALLALLCRLRRKYSLKLAAAHLDHGFLKVSARRYRKSVERLCAALEVPLLIESADVRRLAAAGKRSVEEAGRLARYAFFERAAAKAGASKIATAHTLDDQAETVLLRLLRGAGLRGLAGIPARRKQGGFEVVRPLLFCRKKDLLAFLKGERLSWCVDPTNASNLFTRNRVRRSLIPELARYNPRILETLVSLQGVAASAQDYLERDAARALRRTLKKSGTKSASLDRRALGRLHPAVLSETLFAALRLLKGDGRRITHHHIAALEELVRGPEAGRRAPLPDGWAAQSTASTLEFFRLIDTHRK